MSPYLQHVGHATLNTFGACCRLAIRYRRHDSTVVVLVEFVDRGCKFVLEPSVIILRHNPVTIEVETAQNAEF